MSINQNNNTITAPPARNYGQVLEDLEGAERGHPTDIAGFECIELFSADAPLLPEGLLNTAIDATDASHRVLVLGLNLGIVAGAASFRVPDTGRTGWGWALEADYFDSNGQLQHEAYLTDNGATRAIAISQLPSKAVTITSIVTDAAGSIVTFTNSTEIQDYLKVGMRFTVSTLVDAVNIAVDTVYKVKTIISATSFNLANSSGTAITNASLTSGVMNRGGVGRGGVAITVPFAVTTSDYLEASWPSTQPCAFVKNTKETHHASFEIQNAATDSNQAFVNYDSKWWGGCGAVYGNLSTSFDISPQVYTDFVAFSMNVTTGWIKLGYPTDASSVSPGVVPRAMLDVKGKIATADSVPTALVTGNVTFAVTSNFATVTGTNAVVIGTITGGVAGMLLAIRFVDGNVTITDTDAATTDTVNLNAAFVSAANKTLLLIHNGTKWFEVSRSTNG